MLYRLAGIPAPFLDNDEVLVADEDGNLFLHDRDTANLTPVPAAEIATVVTFYEAAFETDWRAVDELPVSWRCSARFQAEITFDPY